MPIAFLASFDYVIDRIDRKFSFSYDQVIRPHSFLIWIIESKEGNLDKGRLQRLANLLMPIFNGKL